MNNTTPDAIITAINTFLEDGLTPAGGTAVGNKTAYEVIDDDDFRPDPEYLAEAELDRQFLCLDIEPNELDLEGLSQSNVHSGILTLVIGHQIGGYEASRDRKLKDVHQIITQLVRVIFDTTYAPSGVHRIHFLDSSTDVIRDGTYFWTVIKFDITYAMSADYGG